ncbi:hypothetical protein BH23ACT11_BH23ACT11_13390 [soil metagenome]
MTAERYTVVFTGLFDVKKPGEYPYLTMSGDSPGDGGYALHRGQPPYGKFGREIEFRELPAGCRKLVTEVYRDLWGLAD